MMPHRLESHCRQPLGRRGIVRLPVHGWFYFQGIANVGTRQVAPGHTEGLQVETRLALGMEKLSLALGGMQDLL